MALQEHIQICAGLSGLTAPYVAVHMVKQSFSHILYTASAFTLTVLLLHFLNLCLAGYTCQHLIKLKYEAFVVNGV